MIPDLNISEMGPGRIFMDYGPISMVIAAYSSGKPLTKLCRKATVIAYQCLREISSQREELYKPWNECSSDRLMPCARQMWRAVKLTGDQTFTPMAAVAGTIADFTADWLVENGATKVYINNGGDIAIRLMTGEETQVGIIPKIGARRLSHTIRLAGSDGIGGIATSGFGGRSFTRGIADSVTVLAPVCSVADAFATYLANASFIPSSEILQVPARGIDPDTDIPDLLVTIHVGRLTEQDIKASLEQVRRGAARGIEQGYIRGFIAQLGDVDVQYPGGYFQKFNSGEVIL